MVPPGSRQALSNPSDNTVGSFAESDPVKLPDLTSVFARRAERLGALAPGHELEGFLRVGTGFGPDPLPVNFELIRHFGGSTGQNGPSMNTHSYYHRFRLLPGTGWVPG